MDPVTGFSLAAGALSVLDIGFRALSACREIYQNGCLTEHRVTQEITEQLLETTKRLEGSVRSVSVTQAQHSTDVVDLSKRCSKTATELLAELRKLQQDPKGGFRHTVGKSLRTMRKKQYLAETQQKLERERDILNTRILSKLDYHAVLQLQQLDKIDQNVRDLAVALSQGRNTVQQLLTDQTILIQKHVDHRLDAKTNEEEVLRNQQKFKDSLFFPEIFARQEDISRSHEGTCKWIFGPPCDEDEPNSDPENDPESPDLGNVYEYVFETRAQPWSSFKDWLEGDSNDPYWLSGKPGSGKSTLMKYVATEFGKFCYSRTTSSPWRDAVTCCFFFWNLGSSLQKNYVGFLRSLLFQIAEQRAEMIPIMRDDAKCRRSRTHDVTLLYAWTEQRLEDALKRFLAEKPPSIRLCMFIDGLDEFVGDEDRLIETIRLLSQTSGTKVCVASRPEQIFRQGFAASPNLRLQDLNYHDIWKATSERLTPALRSYTSCSKREVDDLIKQVIHNSHGVFLWAELMTKDLKAGARNSDSIAELRERLERTPETIDGLYEHMLNRLDKAYLGGAVKYLSYLLVHQEYFSWNGLPLTLLELACSEQNPWFHPLRLGSALFVSANVVEKCHNLEVRVLTRCAGLVEIKKRSMHPFDFFKRVLTDKATHPDDIEEYNDYTQCLREVEFIHKTAADFLKDHTDFFDDPDLHWTARLAAVRGQITIASLTPDISGKREAAQNPVILRYAFMDDLMGASRPSESCSQRMRVAAGQTVEDFYNLIRFLNADFDWPNTTMSQIYGACVLGSELVAPTPECSPVYDYLNFASFCLRDDYIARFMAENNPSRADFERVIFCAVLGIHTWKNTWYTRKLEGSLVIVRDCMKGAIDLNMDLIYATNKDGDQLPLWAVFIHSITNSRAFITLVKAVSSSEQTSDFTMLWKDILQMFLNRDADPNVMLECVYTTRFFPRGDKCVRITCSETPLASIERLSHMYMPQNESLVDFEDLLRYYGGINRGVCLSVQDESGGPHLLTEDQSNRLMGVFSSDRLARSRPMVEKWSVAIEPMPSQPDPRAEELVTFLIAKARFERKMLRFDYSDNDTDTDSEAGDESLSDKSIELTSRSHDEELSDEVANPQ